MNTAITPGTWARVRLIPDCPGDGRRADHPSEEDCRVQITAVYDDRKNDNHRVFALYKGGGDIYKVPSRPGGLGIGRYFRPDELEPIDPPW